MQRDFIEVRMRIMKCDFRPTIKVWAEKVKQDCTRLSKVCYKEAKKIGEIFREFSAFLGKMLWFVRCKLGSKKAGGF